MAKYYLGLNLGHDRSAALVKDGEILVAIHQERLDRCKHSVGILHQSVTDPRSVQLPYEAIHYCMENCNASWNDVVAISANMPGVNYSHEILKQRLAPELVEKTIVGPLHHDAHAYSAYWPSGFDESLVLVADATGNTNLKTHTTESYTLYHANGNKIKPLHSEAITAHLSSLSTLGFIYEYISRKAGFQTKVGSTISIPEAGKLMGLAPFGGEQKNWHRWINTRHDNYSLGISPYDIFLEVAALEKTYDKGENKPYMRPYLVDLAYKIQHELEEAMLHIIELAIKETGVRKLCLAGGVALNSVTNYKLHKKLALEDMFIFPAAGDAGVAAGCALWAYATQSTEPVRKPLKKATLGCSYSSENIKKALEKYSDQIKVESISSEESIAQTSTMLSKGHIVARFEAGSEYGPRALGHRSIMADPIFEKMKDIVNARVKFREAFRPFAPVIPLENIGDVFEYKVSSPFMLVVAPIKPEYQAKIPGVTHIDGTGRVQTVTKEDNPFFYNVCRKISDIRENLPVILNTSFNIAGQPIVETPEEAIATFLKTDIDYLSLENFWISKKNVSIITYSDHLKTLPENIFPKGLDPDQKPVTDLMRQLDRAIFYGDTDSIPWSSEELKKLSSEGARYKETSNLFPDNPFGRKIHSQINQNKVFLFDPLGCSMLVDQEEKIPAGRYNFKDTILIMAVLDGSSEHLENLRIRGSFSSMEWDRRIAWATKELNRFGLESHISIKQSQESDPILPDKSDLIFSSFADSNFSTQKILKKFHAILTKNDYCEKTITNLLKLESLQRIEPTSLYYYDRFVLEDSILHDLIRLFLLQAPLTLERIVSIFGQDLFEALSKLGVFSPHGREWLSKIALYCVDSLFIATDQRFVLYDKENDTENPVMYIGEDSMGLVHVAPRYPTSRMLDLCTGSGVQALVASRNTLQVTGVDINPRAIRFARFNAQLNGIRNARFVLGSLYEPVAGMTFDIIRANPPFVPSPHEDLGFRDGGTDGEAILRKIIESAASHLTKKGKLHIVTDLVNLDSYKTKLNHWWMGSEADMLVLQTADRNEMQFSMPHSHAPFGQGYNEYNQELHQWITNYRAMKINSVNFGYILIHLLPTGPGSFYQRTIHNPFKPINLKVNNYFKQSQLFSDPNRGSFFLEVNPDVNFRTELCGKNSERSLEIFFPNNPYFTTYVINETILRGIQNINRSHPQFKQFVNSDNQNWVQDLIFKGIINLNPNNNKKAVNLNRRARSRPKNSGHDFGGIKELQTETTPTCLSSYLLR